MSTDRSSASARITGGEAIVASLLAAGFDTLFGLPGVQNDWLYNALHDVQPSIRVIHTRHEQGAAYMALGHTLATGRPALCNVVPGPGILNAAAALATAYGLNAKLLFLTGQIPSAAIGRDSGALHEIPGQLDLLRSLSKWAARINDPAEAPLLIAQAVQQLAIGRPRPVALEVPMDVLARRTAVTLPPPSLPVDGLFPVDGTLIDEAAGLLAAAKAPLIFVGSGAQDVSEEVRELAELLQAPVVGYRTGRGILDSRHALSVMQPAARPLWDAADVVLALGTHMRVPIQKWPRRPERKVVRIDVDAATHGRFSAPDIAVTARLEQALPELLTALSAHGVKTRPSRAAEVAEARTAWERRSAVLEPQISYLKVIRGALGEDGIFVDELTQVGFASRIVMPVYKPRTFISTGYMGTLGYGFPTALGVKVAKPDVPVVSVTGDGGFLFAATELATAVQHGIGLVTLVFNNNQYGNVQQMQRDLYDNRVIATDLVNPDFVAMARAFGADATRVGTPAELAAALPNALETGRPCVIEVQVGDMPSIDQFR
jgi:acetolactate synthase-1/2/3 large subunit